MGKLAKLKAACGLASTRKKTRGFLNTTTSCSKAGGSIHYIQRESLARTRAHSKIFPEECPQVGGFFDPLGRRCARPVAGAAFDPHQYRRLARLSMLQGRPKLKAVHRHNAVVGIGRDDHRWRILRADFDRKFS